MSQFPLQTEGNLVAGRVDVPPGSVLVTDQRAALLPGEQGRARLFPAVRLVHSTPTHHHAPGVWEEGEEVGGDLIDISPVICTPSLEIY